MSTTITPLEQLQQNLFDRINDDLFFDVVNVQVEKPGQTDDDLANALGTVTQRGMKKGALILVCCPFFDVNHPGARGPEIEPIVYVRCITQPMINDGVGGTGITAEALVLQVVRLLHHYVMYDINVTINAHKGDPVMWKDGEREYTATVRTILTLKPLKKCSTPVIAGNSTDGVTITCATAGAIIYYTTDGSNPGPNNTAAEVVSGPLENKSGHPLLNKSGTPLLNKAPVLSFTAGACVRAVAFNQPNQVASDLAYTIIE